MIITEATDPRYFFSQDKLSLTIVGVELMDDGAYTLEAVNRHGNDSASIQMIVFGKLNSNAMASGCDIII